MSGPAIVSGRTLLGMAKKGAAMFRKANSFAEQKWDVKLGQPKESGSTVDDAIEFVRVSMFKALKGEIKVEDVMNERETDQESNFDIEGDLNEELETSDNEKDDVSCSSGNDLTVPETYIFPGFMAFITWGPFADPANRLSLFTVADASKAAAMGRSEKRKIDKLLNDENRKKDGNHSRGLTIDQKISYQSLLIQEKTQQQIQNESTMVGLIAHETAFSKLIESAERRAILRCPDYDSENPHWKKVDQMIDEHAIIVNNLKNYTEQLQHGNNKNDEINSIDNLNSVPYNVDHIMSNEVKEVTETSNEMHRDIGIVEMSVPSEASSHQCEVSEMSGSNVSSFAVPNPNTIK